MSNKKGKLVVISAPSGTGKGTVINKLLKLKHDLAFSISATTRKPRPGETDGVEYFFISKERFKEMIENNEFLEYAEYVGEYYGTPVKPIKEYIDSGKIVILDIEVQGAKQVMAKDIEATTIFLVPPDMEELEKRLRGRGTDSDEVVASRLKRAKQELTEKHHYKYTIINDCSDHAAKEIQTLISN
ncbi:MAG: guanylate kinase [Oscillospiraceae bacterium]|nr:guanylate kinase [Oscillospiraceae bacterium]